MSTPFDPFANAVLTFLVDDPLEVDQTDSAGNPISVKKEVTIECFLKLSKGPYGSLEIAKEFPWLGINAVRIEGYVCGEGKIPSGVNPLDKTFYAKYREQQGEFVLLLTLQSAVKADAITGHRIIGIWRVLGGE
jgi:hypothetical protein